jgi:pimeloyl-ACP methyl ester carboxylesterase
MTEAVILVHGLWMNGLDMTLLRHRIAAAGYAAHQFRYPTVRQSPAENAHDLAAFARRLPQPVVHFVGHSLGGLVLRHLFHAHPDQRPGRVVTLGTPHQQSSAARGFLRLPRGRDLLGRSLEQGLLGDAPAWDGGRDLGSIAGAMWLGLGLLVRGIPRPSDGTVAVSETLLDGMRDHVTVMASHGGLLLSRHAAVQSLHFLGEGRFMCHKTSGDHARQF